MLHFFFMLQKMHFMQLWLESFLDICTQIPKSANCQDFLTKFVNVNNYIHHFFHRVVILQQAKNYIQHEEILLPGRKITLCKVDKKGFWWAGWAINSPPWFCIDNTFWRLCLVLYVWSDQVWVRYDQSAHPNGTPWTTYPQQQQQQVNRNWFLWGW